MADNLKIKFIKDYQVKDEEGKKFKNGSQYSLNAASAAHFISRGAAELVTSKAKKAPAEKAPEKGLLEKARDVISGKGSEE